MQGRWVHAQARATSAQDHIVAKSGAARLGIAVIPSTMQSVRISGIVYRRLRAPVPKASLGLAFRRNDPSPALKQFINVVRTIAKSSPAIQ